MVSEHLTHCHLSTPPQAPASRDSSSSVEMTELNGPRSGCAHRQDLTMVTQEVLSRTITFERSHVHVGFTARPSSSQVAGGEKNIQQVAKVFIDTLTLLPQPAEPVETLALRGNSAPN